MKYDELTGFKCAVAVAVACLEDERPKGESIQPEAAAQYVSDVLEVLLSSVPVEATVEPMTYPRCCKIPLIIRIDGRLPVLVLSQCHGKRGGSGTGRRPARPGQNGRTSHCLTEVRELCVHLTVRSGRRFWIA